MISLFGPTYPPEKVLSYQIGKAGNEIKYKGQKYFLADKSDRLYLEHAIITTHPQNMRGHFFIDIIVWRKYDPLLMANFLEEIAKNSRNRDLLKQFAESFKKENEILLAEQKAKEEVNAAQKAIAAKEFQKVQSGKPSAQEKENVELSERLQKTLQGLKAVDDLKKTMAEQKEREKELLSRLDRLEEEKAQQLKKQPNLPFIALASPQNGATVGDQYINLVGFAEHEQGISKFQILINGLPITPKEKRDLKIVSKNPKRIDFSESIRLREGKNDISIIAQENQGLTSKKVISVQMVKKREEIWAVVIGINKYRNLPHLKYAGNDAKEFYRYLVEVNQVPKDHIWLLLDEEATLDRMRSVLGTQVRRKAGKDDMVIIFLAGHGATEKDTSSLDGDGLEKYILPHNADPKDLYASAMPMTEVARIFDRISSEKLVFLSDTCYSGAAGGRTIPVTGMRANVSATFLERLSQGKGRVIITASDANQVSVEKDDLKHGVFTYYLLEGLRGKADLDGDGAVTVDEIYRYVSMKVPQATGQDQHPVRKGEMTGQIVLGVVR